MIRINLLSDREAIRKETSRQQVSIFALSLCLFGVILGGIHFSMLQKKKGVERRIQETNQVLKELDEKVGRVEDFKLAKKELEKKLEVIEKLQIGKMWAVHVFDEISKTIPEKMWLETLNVAGPSLSMKGYAIDNETIARFMLDMEHSDSFSNIELGVTEQKEVSGVGMKSFSMVATSTPPRGKGTGSSSPKKNTGSPSSKAN